MKSILSFVLVLAMLLSFVACSGDEGNKPAAQTTVPSTDVTTQVITYEQDDLPDSLDFGGEKVIFLTYDSSSINDELVVEDLNSDVVNDSIYNREKFVEDRLNVEIIKEAVIFQEYENIVQKQLSSFDDTYQVYAYKTAALTRFAFDENALTDLYELEYLNLEKPWWSQKYNEEAEIRGSLYFTTGSLSLSLTRFLFAVFYNKNLATNYSANNSALADLNDLYSLVDSGKWTFDKFSELGNTIYTDLNGNSERDEEDVYGIGYQPGISIDAIWSSFDINVLSRTGDDDWFELDVNTDKLYSALEKLNTLLHNTTGCFLSGVSDGALDSTLVPMFAGDTLLFMVNKLQAIENTTMRNMQSEYGLLPYPKYDEKQENYYSYSHDSYTSFAVPLTVENPDCVGAVLEAMASYSYRDTEPAYLDTALKGKYMSDPQSRKMVDLIVDGFKVDTAWIFIETIGDWYPYSYREVIYEGDESYASTHSKRESSMKKTLKIYKRVVDNFK